MKWILQKDETSITMGTSATWHVNMEINKICNTLENKQTYQWPKLLRVFFFVLCCFVSFFLFCFVCLFVCLCVFICFLFLFCFVCLFCFICFVCFFHGNKIGTKTYRFHLFLKHLYHWTSHALSLRTRKKWFYTRHL